MTPLSFRYDILTSHKSFGGFKCINSTFCFSGYTYKIKHCSLRNRLRCLTQYVNCRRTSRCSNIFGKQYVSAVRLSQCLMLCFLTFRVRVRSPSSTSERWMTTSSWAYGFSPGTPVSLHSCICEGTFPSPPPVPPAPTRPPAYFVDRNGSLVYLPTF